jgi:hypothetical protein
VTRSHKFNDRDHKPGAPHQVSVPKYFGKNGFGGDPNRLKKDGDGKRNWYVCVCVCVMFYFC